MDACSIPEHKIIKEGPAEIRLVARNVFYNPVQEFNRDLSILVLNVFSEDYLQEKTDLALKKAQNSNEKDKTNDVERPEVNFQILEALSATGLRSIRYAKEVPNATKIYANDISHEAVETMKVNMKHNQVEHIVEASQEDASMLMYRHKLNGKYFAAIDLDPYGCPSIFLDAAVQSIHDGGLLLVTATDMAVLAGNSPESCYTKYGAISLKTKCCHEMALRILLQSIQQNAIKYGRYIEPLLSISVDFYIRVFVRVRSGPIHSKKTSSKSSMVYHCVGCGDMILRPLGGYKPNPTEEKPNQIKAFLPTGPAVGANCVHCNQKHHLGGPIWSAPIHDKVFVGKLIDYLVENTDILGTRSRLEGVLSVVYEEQDTPLYYTMEKLVGTVHMECISMLVMRSAIINAGYEVSYSHASRSSIKTDAPAQLLWDILRTYSQTHPVKASRVESDPVARALLSQEIKYKVDFSLRIEANPISRRERRLRFQFNPERHWGPGTRDIVNIGELKISKSIRKQNKTSKRKDPERANSEDDSRKKPNSDDIKIIL